MTWVPIETKSREVTVTRRVYRIEFTSLSVETPKEGDTKIRVKPTIYVSGPTKVKFKFKITDKTSGEELANVESYPKDLREANFYEFTYDVPLRKAVVGGHTYKVEVTLYKWV